MSTSVANNNDATGQMNTKSSMTTVVFVSPGNAKIVKTQLELHGWLDKGYRMTKVMIPSATTSEQQKQQQQVAVPITTEAWEELSTCISSSSEDCDADTKHLIDNADGAWRSLILGHSRMEMPFSTAKFASKGKRR